MSNKLAWDHDYSVNLNIGMALGDRDATINPSTESDYTEAEWDQLTREQQEDWLTKATRAWAMEYVEYSWKE